MRRNAGLVPKIFGLCLIWASSGAEESDMSVAAENLLSSLSENQSMQITYRLEGDERSDWHFVPKKGRKGLPLKAMTAEQVYLVNILLNESLGQAGYSKTNGIMHLEAILRGIDVAHGLAQHASHHGGARLCTHHDVHRALWVLVEGSVNPRLDFGRQARVRNVSDDTDDLHALRSVLVHPNPPPDRILIRPEAASHALTDDHHRRRGGVIPRRKRAAFHQVNPHCPEIAGRDAVPIGVVSRTRRRGGATFD